METIATYLLIFITVLITIQLGAVTVNPSLCPTNKIAPHRRIASSDPIQPRTLRIFYDLLAPNAPNRPYNDPLNDLQEQPQEDDPNDCGEIEDYDETDLSSVTQQVQKKKNRRHDKTLFGNSYRPQYPPSNSPTPTRPQRPPSSRPPYWSGGIFGSNSYRPPPQQYPSNHIKPVQEDTPDPYATYRPAVVGGLLGHVVGFSTVRPTRRPRPDATTQRPFRFPDDPEPHITAPRTRPSHLSKSIVGSFVDLFFK